MDAKFGPAFLTVKVLDIGYVTFLYFIFGLIAAKAFDYAYGRFESKDYKKEPWWKLFISIILHISFVGVVAYALRNLIEIIPSPFNGLAGFSHHRLKELEGGVVLGVVLFFFQESLMDKVKYFAQKYLGVEQESAEDLIEVRLRR